MPLYVGEFESNYCDGRVVIPRDFEEPNLGSGFRGSPVILFPVDEQVLVYNYEYLVEIFAGESERGSADWLRGMDWTRSIQELVAKHRLRWTCSVYQTNHVSSRAKSVVMLLEQEKSSAASRLSGGDLRRLLRQCLRACGVDIQMTVQMLDRRIHLMLGICDGDDRNVTIIECRQKAASPACMEVSEVMRLYGLTEAIGDEPSLGEAFIAWTAGLSPQVGSLAKLYEMRPIDRFRPLDWIRRKAPESEEDRLPLLKYAHVDERGRLYLPKCLVEYLGTEGGVVTFVGTDDHLEIWNTKQWERRVDDELRLCTDESDDKRFAYDVRAE